MTPAELRDPVYLRAWCVDQANMLLTSQNGPLSEIIEMAHGLEAYVKAAIPPAERS